MFLNTHFVFLTFSIFGNFNLVSTITCSGEISIKSAQSVYSSPFYQKAFSAYSVFRTSYGLNVKLVGEQYANRSQWNNAVNRYDESGYRFSVLDTELLDKEKSTHPDFLSIPVAVGNFIFVYNLKDINGLNLTVDAIVDIYLGVITTWNDTELQKLNPSVDLPETKIEVYAASNDTAQNYYLSYFLGIYSSAWRKRYGQEPFFTMPSRSNIPYSFASASSMLNSINMKRNSFGYTTWSFLYNFVKPNNISLTTIVNVKYDDVVSALPFSVKDLLGDGYRYSASTFHTVPNLTQNNKPYPFLYFQNVVMNKISSATRSCCQSQESLGFVDFFLDFNNETAQGMYGYFPMPNAATKNIRSALLPLVKCDGTASYDDFKNLETLDDKAKRQTLIMISVPSVLGSVLLTVLLAFGIYYKKLKLAKETFWIINSNEIIFDKNENSQKYVDRSALSIHSCLSEKIGAPLKPTTERLGKKFEGKIGIWMKMKIGVLITRIDKAKSLNAWKRGTKGLVGNFCSNISHNNLSLLYGISNMDGIPHAINQFCTKGTLSYVLSTCSYSLSHDIKYNLAHDVIQGLNYLHKKGIVHGQLTSFSCDVDGMWVVKLTNWDQYSIRLLEQDGNTVNRTVEIDQIEDNVAMVKLLYLDPEAWGLTSLTYPVDLYSYGMLLVEIFTQKTPFFDELELCIVQYSNLLQNKANKIYDVPTMSTTAVPPDVQSLINVLIRADGVSRPSSAYVLRRLRDLKGSVEKSVVDIVMQTLETYVLELEDKVVERTSELIQMTNRMKDLLNQLLPPQIAAKFIQGQTVEPEFFECASILFSDIVGFTTISARSTPIQVMSFLNELWKVFDQTVERFDVYKVDTIGDAYMVASGLPIRNGIHHCKCVADLAVALIRLSDTFAIPHLNEEKLKIRIGINSGPVTAGIVGYKMPQYCVFGDTVNTASRMESTSVPYKIQVSECFRTLMADYFPMYQFEYRGETQIKGKGSMKTYWLQ